MGVWGLGIGDMDNRIDYDSLHDGSFFESLNSTTSDLKKAKESKTIHPLPNADHDKSLPVQTFRATTVSVPTIMKPNLRTIYDLSSSLLTLDPRFHCFIFESGESILTG
jgi:hypothetical protein